MNVTILNKIRITLIVFIICGTLLESKLVSITLLKWSLQGWGALCTAGTVHSKLLRGFDVSWCKRILGFIIKHDVLEFCIWEFVVFDGDDVYSVCKDDQMYSL